MTEKSVGFAIVAKYLEPVAARDSARNRATLSRARAGAPPREPVARAGERARQA